MFTFNFSRYSLLCKELLPSCVVLAGTAAKKFLKVERARYFKNRPNVNTNKEDVIIKAESDDVVIFSKNHHWPGQGMY
jgi:hypothetical protein